MKIKKTIKDLQNENKYLNKICLKLFSALKFYADPDTYFAIGFLGDSPCGDFLTDFSKTHLDKKPGKRARKAILGLQKYSYQASAEKMKRINIEIENDPFFKNWGKTSDEIKRVNSPTSGT